MGRTIRKNDSTGSSSKKHRRNKRGTSHHLHHSMHWHYVPKELRSRASETKEGMTKAVATTGTQEGMTKSMATTGTQIPSKIWQMMATWPKNLQWGTDADGLTFVTFENGKPARVAAGQTGPSTTTKKKRRRSKQRPAPVAMANHQQV